MSVSIKLSALTLAMGIAFSGSAFAASDVWDTPNPWGTSTLSEFAAWNVFGGTTDNSPEVAGSGTGSVKENTGQAFLTGGGNIYSFSAATNFTATLAGSTSGLFDVYLRIGTLGTAPVPTALLNGVSATKTSVVVATLGGFGGSEIETFWKWSNVTGSSLYTFRFGSLESSMSLDQLALATVAIPTIPTGPVAAVPEPETYAMMLSGLGLMGFVARRRSKKS
ncbi:MAG TPA: PEP-CTERM sorting domain-containing protein [Methylophilaceae bacterium]|nr:PEP-CTERM sorting domain-containing protein [Methylophilaceae bacterium]